MEEVETRLDRLIRKFVADYLQPILALLADEGIGSDEQRDRADALVRALLAAEVTDGLRSGGRRQVVEIDAGGASPEIVFNAAFVGDVEEGEALGLLEEPVSELLGVSRFRVGLIFQLDDEQSLRTVVNRARRSGGTLIGSAAIPSVVAFRLRGFDSRIEEVAAAYDRPYDLQFDSKGAVDSIVESPGSEWPNWTEISGSPFMQAVLLQLEDVFSEGDHRPASEVVAEICWESLDLSPRSALRRAAELLRAHVADGSSLETHLRRFAGAFAGADSAVPEWAGEWPDFEEVAEAWAELFRSEQRLLAWATVRRETPRLSVFEPPERVLHLDEPKSLPWGMPLIGWSMRERRALCDLLQGHCTSIRSKLPEITDVQPVRPGGATDAGLRRRGEGIDFEFCVDPDPERIRAGRGRTLERAVRACTSELYDRFATLESDRRREVIRRMRGAYDERFDSAAPVWERRFQAWRTLEPTHSFGLIALEAQHVLGPRTFLDPFAKAFDPANGESLRREPAVVLVAAFREDEESAGLRVPLAALRSASGSAPLVVRAVEVPSEDETPSRWLGDTSVRFGTLGSLPHEEVLAAIRDDSANLQLKRARRA